MGIRGIPLPSVVIILFQSKCAEIINRSSRDRQSVSVRTCVRASHACVRKSRCEGGAKLHGIVRANVRACMVFWVRHTRAITLEIFQ